MAVNRKALNTYKERAVCYLTGIVFNRSDLLIKITGNESVFDVIKNAFKQHLLLPFSV